MSKLRLAVLGCGDVALRDYLPELHRLADQVELVAVFSRSEGRARHAAAQFGARAWFTDDQRLLRESSPELVVNLTPIQVHDETNLAAVQAGTHLYSEKPVASGSAVALRLREVARENGCVLVCAPSVLLFPQLRMTQRLLTEGQLGPVHAARGEGHGGVPPWSGYISDPTPFFALGGGPLRDMGIYPLHALTGLWGPVRRVSAMSSRAQDSFIPPDGPAAGRRIPIEVPDNWTLILDFGAQRLATVIATNCVQGTRAPQLEIFGLAGTLAVNLLDVSAPLELLSEGSWRSVPVEYERTSGGPDHLLGVAHLVECIQLRRPPISSIEQAIHVLRVIEAAELSARSGVTVDVFVDDIEDDSWSERSEG